MRPTIKVQDLSKQYQIGTVRPPYQTFRESLTSAVRIPFKRREAGSQSRTETIWALKDVNFEVQPGETVGIIGKNGAGKSTLLKILSRVTEPTSGRVELHGRIGSLLEVGTGFHPELTGRENVFLSGAILGMSRVEIRRKFDEIVAFSEIERFIDTPVKWYSSGMYVRLAFSVSAHLEPEVLILDEVLAVGDAAFRRKCLDKMQEIREQGSTILFVSHDMNSVARICPRAIMFSEGCITHEGPSSDVISAYLGLDLKEIMPVTEWTDENQAPGNEIVRLRSVRVIDDAGEVSGAVDIRYPVRIVTEYQVLQPGYELIPDCQISNAHGLLLFVTGDLRSAWARTRKPPGRYRSTVVVPGNFLSEGTMFVSVAMNTVEPLMLHYLERETVGFQVIDNFAGDSVRGHYTGPVGGVVRPLLHWETEQVSNYSEIEVSEIRTP